MATVQTQQIVDWEMEQKIPLDKFFKYIPIVNYILALWIRRSDPARVRYAQRDFLKDIMK